MEPAYRKVERESVLLVEDEELLIRMMALYLEANGYQVESCRDGAVALDRLKSTHFDVLVTDWELPGRKGNELVKWCQGRQEAMKVVVVSGDEVDVKFKSRKVRIGFMRKPFLMNDLLEMVRRM